MSEQERKTHDEEKAPDTEQMKDLDVPEEESEEVKGGWSWGRQQQEQ